jgi:pyruvate,water dikinase
MTSNPNQAEQQRKEDLASILGFKDLRREDVGKVGGKNSSLGEMVSTLGAMGVQVPPGFATTSAAYWQFIEANDLRIRMSSFLDNLAKGRASVAQTGQAIRSLILGGDWPEDAAQAIVKAYRELSARARKSDASVAVRSSATSEDLPDASFAGQQETFLNIVGEAV